jgi:hypothetical protein
MLTFSNQHEFQLKIEWQSKGLKVKLGGGEKLFPPLLILYAHPGSEKLHARS